MHCHSSHPTSHTDSHKSVLVKVANAVLLVSVFILTVVLVVLPVMLVVLSLVLVVLSLVLEILLVMLVILPVMLVIATVVLMILVRIARITIMARRSVARIFHVDIMHIDVVAPSYRTIEIIRITVHPPLSGSKHALQLPVTLLPSVGIDVAVAPDAVEIREVDVQYTVSLNAVQAQFHHHLVSDKACLSLNVSQSLRIDRCNHHECRCDCK